MQYNSFYRQLKLINGWVPTFLKHQQTFYVLQEKYIIKLLHLLINSNNTYQLRENLLDAIEHNV